MDFGIYIRGCNSGIKKEADYEAELRTVSGFVKVASCVLTVVDPTET